MITWPDSCWTSSPNSICRRSTPAIGPTVEARCLRPAAHARRVDLRLRAWGAVEPADRAALDGGRCVSGGGGQPADRPRDHRPVPGAARGRDRTVVRPGAGGLRPGGGAAPGSGRDRWHQVDRERVREREPQRVELAEQILKEAEATDAAEEAAEKAAEKGAGSSGSGSPATFGPRAGRRARLRELLQELQAEATEKSYEAHIARRAEIERTTGRPLRGRRPSPTSSTHKSRRQVQPHRPRQPAVEGSCQCMRATRS